MGCGASPTFPRHEDYFKLQDSKLLRYCYCFVNRAKEKVKLWGAKKTKREDNRMAAIKMREENLSCYDIVLRLTCCSAEATSRSPCCLILMTYLSFAFHSCDRPSRCRWFLFSQKFSPDTDQRALWDWAGRRLTPD